MRIPPFIYGPKTTNLADSAWTVQTILRGTPGNREGADAIWGGKLQAGGRDVVIGGWEETGDVTLTTLNADGSPDTTYDIDGDAGNVEGVLVADVLGLGYKQIVIASQSNGLYLYDVHPTTFVVNNEYRVENGTDGIGALEVVAWDMNGNGRLDLIAIGNGTAGVGWYEQPATPGDNWTRHEIGASGWGMAVHVLERGGLPQVLFCERDGDRNGGANESGFVWFKNNGDGTFEKRSIDVAQLTSARQSHFVELNGELSYVLVPIQSSPNEIRCYIVTDGDPDTWDHFAFPAPLTASSVIQSVTAVILPGDTRHSLLVFYADAGGDSGGFVMTSSDGKDNGIEANQWTTYKFTDPTLDSNDQKWDAPFVMTLENGSMRILACEQFDPASGIDGKGLGLVMYTPP